MEATLERTADHVEQQLIEGEAIIARVRARQAELLADADRMQLATGDGCRTLAEWTASRLDVAPETAHRLVRMARSADERPQVFSRLVDGDWSFDRTVESDRWVIAGATEDQVVADGPRFDIAGLQTRVALTRRVTPSNEQEAFEARHLVFQRSLDRTRSRFWGELPGADGELVEQNLSAVADTFPPLPDGTRPAHAQRLADALVARCTGQMTTSRQQHEPGDSPVDIEGLIPASAGVLSVFVDNGAAHTSGGYTVGDSVINELLCDAHIEQTILQEDGTAAEAGGRNTVTDRQRRRITHRDKTCGADACTSRYRLQIHHRTWQAEGGTHDDDNLVLLCWYHHHIVIHRHGFTINPTSPPGRLRFHRPPTDRAPPRRQ